MIQDNYKLIPFPCDSCSDNCVLTDSKSNICDKLVYYNVAVLEKQLENMNLESALNYFGDIINLNVKGVVQNPTRNYVICANHCSYADPILILLAMQKLGIDISNTAIVVATEVAQKFPEFCKGFECISVDRVNNPLRAIYDIEERAVGKNIILFPEGTRSRTGKLNSLKSGVGQISTDMNLPVLPVYIKGAYEFWNADMLIPRAGSDIEIDFLNIIEPSNRKQMTKDLYNVLKDKENEYSC